MRSNTMRALLILVVAVGVATSVATARANVSQTPGATGCPAGYDLLSVASFEAVGPYYLPRLVDSGGNNDGYVCAHAQPDSVRDADCKNGNVVACQLAQLGLPHYLFKDNTSPAAK